MLTCLTSNVKLRFVMTYDSPKTIRRRQQRQNDAPRKRTHAPRPIKVSTDEEWGRTCDFAIACLHTQANEGHCDAAGRHARALVTLAVYRRACQIMRAYGYGYVKAMRMAQVELLGVS